jgi:hypothetical protein
MNQEDEMTEPNIPELTPALGRIRADLVTAVARDRSRAARRRKTYLAVAVALVGVGAVGGAIAAVTGAFSPAPPQVKQTFEDLNSGPDAPGVDASRAVQIGVIDEHPAYAAPTEGGGFCLYFAPNPGVVQRSGPSGSVCTANDPGPKEIALTPQMGHDGGFAFGRVGTADAVKVEIELPDASGIVTASVGSDRFFLAGLPERALTALTHGKTVSAVARNADGAIVARSTPEGLGLGMPTETGPDLNN